MTEYLEMTLKHPITLPSNQVLSTVTFRRATAGDTMLARAHITNDKRFGVSCINDPFVLNGFLMRRTMVQSNVTGPLPVHWNELLSMEDFASAFDILETLSGFYESVADYQAAVKAQQAAAQASAEAGEGVAEPTASFPAATPNHEGSGPAGSPTGNADEGGTGTGSEPASTPV
jgi:hypothetical protein